MYSEGLTTYTTVKTFSPFFPTSVVLKWFTSEDGKEMVLLNLLCNVSRRLGRACMLSGLCVLPDGQAVVEVQLPGASDQQEALVRKRTAGVLDMGGVSTQIAYEVPQTVSFASPQQVIIHQTNSVLFFF